MTSRVFGVLLLAISASCAKDDGPDQAIQTFTAFQEALQGQEVESCRDLLTVESQQVLAEMPWGTITQKQPLQVLSATREHAGRNKFAVDVVDPNNDGAAAQFIVVKEHGRMVVDLVASAGRNAQIVEASGSVEQFEPRKLTPADYDKIREIELSQPHRAKADGN